MKKILLLPLLATLLAISSLRAQTACYWVLLTDKQGTTFDPYTYFDAKAIERYQQCGASLWDESNYPVAPAYQAQVEALAVESLGPSRWLNAVAVMATPEQVEAIAQLPFVREVRMVGGQWQLCQAPAPASPSAESPLSEAQLTDQLVRMGGPLFKAQGIDGRGIRVAVFDGGFPHVNTHQAFKHLRDEGRILSTWNFPDRKENVYLAGSHGTMTLSCIAGCLNGKQIGLATGAEFLLARTEVEPEPFKEEVWWMQAMEWADKNGAQIISSSLGYGKERHYTYEMDGRSYVAKAANMAARKGILVCNSAGNEGDDRRWRTIITPADADSVLCVAGIEDRLDVYRHIKFSSYGPGADGRRKPNVCAFGHAYTAKHNNDTALTQAYGTSFSCPLVAGFAACAWQTRPQASAMEMMQLIEHSADLYPYYDYALGYGVPQASFFLGNPSASAPTFRFEDKGFYIAIVPTEKYVPAGPAVKFEEELTTSARPAATKPTLFLKAQNKKGEIEKYHSLEFDQMDPSLHIAFRKGALYRRTLVVHYNGYTDSLTFSDTENRRLRDNGQIQDFEYTVIDSAGYCMPFIYEETMSRSPEDNKVNEKPLSYQFAILYGALLPIDECYNDQLQINFRMLKPLRKRYLLGMGLNWNSNSYRHTLGVGEEVNQHNQHAFGLELFQRVILSPGGQVTRHGIHWDLGMKLDWNYLMRSQLTQGQTTTLYEYNPDQYLPFTWQATTRLSYDWLGIYANFNLSNYLSKGPAEGVADAIDHSKLPFLSVGMQIQF